MLEKMTPNQRLVIAVVLSFIFFLVYTTIFPPQEVPQEEKKIEKVELKDNKQANQDKTPSVTTKSDVVETKYADEKMPVGKSDTLVTINNDKFTMKIDTLGRISSKVLLEEKFYNKDGKPAELIPQNKTKPLFVRFADEELNKLSQKTPYSASASNVVLEAGKPVKIRLTQNLPELTIIKDITFYADGHYDVKLSLSKETRHFVYLGHRPMVSDQMMTVIGAMVYAGDNLTTIFEDGDVEGRSTFSDVHLTSAFDQYSATIFYKLNPDINVYVDRSLDSNPVVYFDAPKNVDFSGYIGPKDYQVLHQIDPVLVNAIEYGWFTFAAKPLFAVLMWLHGIFGNWGWAIIALTILIRIALYPLTYKGMMSMQKMKELAPKIKDIQAKYKGDPQRMNAAVMDMYKKHGANPLGGCLPLILQIPVFFAIYRVLLNAVELQGAPWILWVTDLSRMDPTFILPILMGASMYYQQKLTPSNFTDPMQEKVFKFLPIIFTFFFLTFPSGLVLYWFVNNLFSIGQQFAVNKSFEAAKAERHEKHLAEKHHENNKS
jgi:YidC/Oxa1 family membrane protein insertase